MIYYDKQFNVYLAKDNYGGFDTSLFKKDAAHFEKNAKEAKYALKLFAKMVGARQKDITKIEE